MEQPLFLCHGDRCTVLGLWASPSQRAWFGLALRAATCMMPAMLSKRVPQPPLNAAQRDLERHDFWPGFIAAIIGVLLLFCGARHLTGVDTIEGSTASEAQLTKAFSAGGLQYADQMPPPAPPRLDDSAAAAEELAQI